MWLAGPFNGVQHLDRQFIQYRQTPQGRREKLKLIRVFQFRLRARCLAAAVPTCPVTGGLQQHITDISHTYRLPSPQTYDISPRILIHLPFFSYTTSTIHSSSSPRAQLTIHYPPTIIPSRSLPPSLRLPVPDHPSCDSIRLRLTAPTLPYSPTIHHEHHHHCLTRFHSPLLDFAAPASTTVVLLLSTHPPNHPSSASGSTIATADITAFIAATNPPANTTYARIAWREPSKNQVDRARLWSRGIEEDSEHRKRRDRQPSQQAWRLRACHQLPWVDAHHHRRTRNTNPMRLLASSGEGRRSAREALRRCISPSTG